MSRRKLLAALPVVLAGLTAFGLAARGQPAGGPTAREVRSLIGRLGSASFREREAATAALGRIGSPALDALRAAARSEDPEVRARARPLARAIGRRLAVEEFTASLNKHRRWRSPSGSEEIFVGDARGREPRRHGEPVRRSGGLAATLQAKTGTIRADPHRGWVELDLCGGRARTAGQPRAWFDWRSLGVPLD